MAKQRTAKQLAAIFIKMKGAKVKPISKSKSFKMIMTNIKQGKKKHELNIPKGMVDRAHKLKLLKQALSKKLER